MKIDLFKLNKYNSVEIDAELNFPEEMYSGMDIRAIRNCWANGVLCINLEDQLELEMVVKGTFILPCAVTLEDVSYDFTVNITENIGNFNDFYNKKQNSLDILPFIWENIVSEVPMRVVKEGVSVQNTSGNGWELVSEE